MGAVCSFGWHGMWSCFVLTSLTCDVDVQGHGIVLRIASMQCLLGVCVDRPMMRPYVLFVGGQALACEVGWRQLQQHDV